MSPRFGATLVFLAAFVALPLPLLGLDGVVVPPARFAQLASVVAVLIALEGTGGMVMAFLALFGGHAVVYSALLGAAAWALARFVLPRLPHRVRDHGVVILASLMLALGTYADLYETRFHHASAHATLLELYR